MAPPEGHKPVIEAPDQDDDFEPPVEHQPAGGVPNDGTKGPNDAAKAGTIDIDIPEALSQFGTLISRAKEAAGYALPTVLLFGGLGGDDRPAAAGAKDAKDGKAAPKDAADIAPLKALSADDRLTATDLRALATKSFPNAAEREAFLTNLDKFEKRADTDKISREDREKFYAQVGRILQNADAGGNTRFKPDEMRKLASDVMRHGAAPGTVNQGGYPTCTAAALEESLYKAEPATIATLVADVAITGQYKTVDGTVITPPERNLKPDKYNHDSPDNKRSSANQIAQITLLNVHWNRQDAFGGVSGTEGEGERAPVGGKKGKLFYEEGHPKDNMGDSQVRIMDHSTNPPTPITTTSYRMDPTQEPGAALPLLPVETPIDSPAMSIGKIGDIYSQLRGHKELTLVSSYEHPRNHSPKTAADFKKLFEQAAAGENGMKFPIVLGVHANLEPFRSDMRVLTPDGGKAKDPKDAKKEEERLSTMHAHHAVSAFDYDPKTGMVTVENQWGLDVDHTGAPSSKAKIHIDDLFKAYKGEDDKAVPAKPREEKKPTGDEYIAEQKKFVDELAADPDVKPSKLLAERLTLQRYVQHWKGDAEAQKLMPDIAKDFKAMMADGKQSYESKVSLSQDLLPLLKKAGMTDAIKDSLGYLNKSLLDKISATNEPHDSMNQIKALHKLQTEYGDKESAAKLINDFVTIAEKRRQSDTEHGAFRQMSRYAVKDLAELGYGDAGRKMLEQLLTENRALEKEKGDTDPKVLRNKIDLAHMLESMPERKDEYRKMIAEMEATHAKMSKDPPTDDKRRNWEFGSLQCALRDYYADNKDTKNLIKITNEIMEGIAKGHAEDGGWEARQMIGPLQHQAKILMEGGASAEAVAMMEKAYALTKKFPEESRSERVPDAMAEMYRKVGKVKEAEAVEKEAKEAAEARRKRRD